MAGVQQALILALAIVREDDTLSPVTHFKLNQAIQHLTLASSAPDALKVETASCQ